jgi:hypothetical protein
MRTYHYVGPEEIAERAAAMSPGVRIATLAELESWLTKAGQEPRRDESLTTTFVIDDGGNLRLAHRRSEHFACAGGGMVWSAGEISFVRDEVGWRVEAVSNQSTGYCPEPESWPQVAAGLDRIGISHPNHFTTEITFRRCPTCGQINIVKDDWFVCSMCSSDLPRL